MILRFLLPLLSFHIITFSLYIPSFSKVFILISVKATSPQEFQSLLLKNSNYFPYTDLIEAEMGTVSREAIDFTWPVIQSKYNEIENESERFTYTFNELILGFLSPIKKRLLLQAIKSSYYSATFSQESDQKLQYQVLNEGILRHPGGIQNSPFFPKRTDDRLYINGFLIPHQQWHQLQFYPQLYYHIGYISNTYQPQFLWVSGEKIMALPQIPLLQGTCAQATIETTETAPATHSFLGVFPGKCLQAVTERESPKEAELKDLNFMTSYASSTPSNSTWSSKEWFKWGSGLLLLGLIVHELNNNYEIQFSF